MLETITIFTTMRCDLRCLHCLRGFPKERPDFPMDMLDKLLVEALPFGVKHVALTGGEPHLHPEFEKMIDKIVTFGYTWHFVSHGQRTEPYLKVMEKNKDKISHVTLSVDGVNAETHDEIRNRKGAFVNVQNSARKYVELGYKVRLSVVLNQRNKFQVDAFVQIARDWGAYGINFAGVIPVDWGKELVLNDAESFRLYEQLLDLREKTKFDIRPLSSLYTRGGVNFCRILNLHELTFNARGEMIFCCDTNASDSITGSLRDHSFTELIALWLNQSRNLQAARAKLITSGRIGEKFDTCAFCNSHNFGEVRN